MIAILISAGNGVWNGVVKAKVMGHTCLIYYMSGVYK